MSEEAKHGSKHAAGHGDGDHEEHEGAPEWLISFADNTALMMGFFVILLALNMGPKGASSAAGADSGSDAAKKQEDAELDWAIGVRAAFNNPVRLNSTDPRDQRLVKRLLERQAQGEGIEEGPKGQGQKVQSIRPTDYRALSGAVMFEDNSTTLTSEARQTLADIAERTRGLRMIIEIHGHASAAEAFYQNDKAMRLSFERAMAVATALTEMGLDWKQLRLNAVGDADRLKLVAYSKSDQRQNQRVEVVVTNETVQGQEP